MSIERNKPKGVLQVSLRRAGSTTLQRTVLTHPNVEGTSEFISFHTRKGGMDRNDPQSPIIHRDSNDFDPTRLYKDMEHQPLMTWWLRNVSSFFSSGSERLPHVRYGKETFANLHLGILLKILPEDLHIIYLERDPRAIATSYKEGDLFRKWNVRGLFKQIKQTVAENPELRKRYRNLVEVDEENAPWTDLLARKMLLLQKEIERHTNERKKTKKVVFENFQQNTTQVLQDIFDWLEIPHDPSTLLLGTKYTRTDTPQPHLMHPLYMKRHPQDWIVKLTDQEQTEIEKVYSENNATLPQYDKAQIQDELKEITSMGRNHRSKSIPGAEYKEISHAYRGRNNVIEDIDKKLISLPGREGVTLAKHLVTNGEFLEFLEWLDQHNIQHDSIRYLFYNPARGKIKRDQQGKWSVNSEFINHPIVSMSWLGAKAFASWVGYRLPFLNEWLEANSYNNPNQNNNINQNYGGTTHINSLPPNKLGIHDMIGNVREWTETFVSDESVATPGGSWEDPPEILKKHQNLTSIAVLSDKNLGFRLGTKLDSNKILSDQDFSHRLHNLLNYLNSEETYTDSLPTSQRKIRQYLEY